MPSTTPRLPPALATVALDIGASRVEAAVDRGDGAGPVPLVLGANRAAVPSLVAVDPDGVVCSGERALAARAAGAATVGGPRRLLGDPTPITLGPREASAAALVQAQLADVFAATCRILGGTPGRVALVVPPTWGPYRRQEFHDAAVAAGIDHPRLVTEPEAALAGADDATADRTAVVCDIGGTTLTVSVVRRRRGTTSVLGQPVVDDSAGGAGFDQALLEEVDRRTDGGVSRLDDVADAEALDVLREQAMGARHGLDTATSVQIDLAAIGDRPVRVTRGDLARCVDEPVKALLAAVETALDAAGLRPVDVDVVLLVGGAAGSAVIADSLARFGRPLIRPDDPGHCVAVGAARAVGRPESAGAAGSAVPSSRPIRRRRPRRAVLAAVAAASAVVVASGVTVGLVLTGHQDTPPVDARLPPAVGRWSMEETGTSLTDSVSPGGNALVTGGTLALVPGPRAGTSARVFACSCWAQSAGAVVHPGDDYTVAAWVLPSVVDHTMTAVSQRSGRDSAFYLGYNGGAHRFVFSTVGVAGQGSKVFGTAAPVEGQWHLLTAVVDAHTGNMTLFVDGVLQASSVWSAATSQSAPGPFVIGRETYAAVPGNYWDGSIGPVVAYADALTPQMVASVYTHGF